MAERVDLGQGRVCMMRKSRRTRRLRLAVYRDGSISLTLPFFVSYACGRAFLRSKADWIREKAINLASRPENMLFRGSTKEYRDSRSRARELVLGRLEHFQKVYRVTWKGVSIRNQKTRWGSCSRTGGLSFNYRLLLLPSHLSDYVIVHELCHLLEMNHSPRFWALVARIFPDYLALRRELRLR